MKKFFKKWLKSTIWKIFFIIIFMTVKINILTAQPRIIGRIVDLLYDIPNTNNEIYKQIGLLMLTVLGLLVFRLPWRAMSQSILLDFEKKLKDFIFAHFMKIKMEKIQNIKNGEIMAYFTKDITGVRRFIGAFINQGIRSIVIFIIAIISMITTCNLKLTLLTIIPIIIVFIIVFLIKRYVENALKISRKNFTELSEYVQESTDGIRTIKAYSGEDEQIRVFDIKSKKLRDSNIKVSILSNIIMALTNLSFGIGIGFSLIYGSKLVSSNVISLGDLVAFNGYIVLFLNPLVWIPQIVTKYKDAMVSFDKLNRFFNLETEEVEIKKEKNGIVNGDIVFKDLTYNYPANIEVALKNINLEIKQGTTLGIIGTIGSGKTTLMNLLLRLYSVPNDKIYIGGKDINTIKINDLRDSICYITQEHFLFSTSIKENIELFRDNYSLDEINESTQNAMIADDISRMEDGINTVVGERGIDLSGGQKQRVVISRAFLQNSNIVIFDDTFSALDNKTEESLLNNIKKLTKDKTCIIISNRISDVKDADDIIVLDDGEILQHGIHNDLIKENGLYQKFYNQQSSKSNMEVGELIG